MTRRPSSLLLALGLSLGLLLLAGRSLCDGFDPKNMDASVSPCADFFEYAVGAWERRTFIPPSYSQYGVDEEVEQRTFTIVKDILEGAATDTLAPKGSERQKVGDFFASGMDAARIEAEGVRPLESFFARIAAVRDRKALADEIARLQEMGVGAAFQFEVGPDDTNSALNIPQLSQGGLSLPDRGYYLTQDASSKRLRAQYVEHVTRDVPAPGGRRRHRRTKRPDGDAARDEARQGLHASGGDSRSYCHLPQGEPEEPRNAGPRL